MHVPLGFMVTGGIEDLQTGEITQNGAKMVTNTRLPIGIDRHCMAGNNAHWLMLRGYNTGATDFVGRRIDTLPATVSAYIKLDKLQLELLKVFNHI